MYWCQYTDVVGDEVENQDGEEPRLGDEERISRYTVQDFRSSIKSEFNYIEDYRSGIYHQCDDDLLLPVETFHMYDLSGRFNPSSS